MNYEGNASLCTASAHPYSNKYIYSGNFMVYDYLVLRFEHSVLCYVMYFDGRLYRT